MHCVVTAGPTYEALDRVRRLTNFSTGRLGVELADYLASAGHRVTLLVGEQATWPGERRAAQVRTFSDTADLGEQFRGLVGKNVGAVFHAAAVSDFKFGRVWAGQPGGELIEAKAGKFSSRGGPLIAELLPTPKIIAELRAWFPTARIVGWKYEVEGDRAAAIQTAEAQLRECRTDACVVNGPAYGDGFGLVTGVGRNENFAAREALFIALAKRVQG